MTPEVNDQSVPPNQQALSVALRLAGKGVKVFPAQENGAPVPGFRWKDEATTDASKLRAYFLHAYKNTATTVGMPCGLNDLVVIDPDAKNGTRQGVEEFNRIIEERGVDLSRIPVINTPSGGKHYIFQQTAGARVGCGRGELHKHIDVKGDGGYVIAVGSIRNGKKYVQQEDTPDFGTLFEAGMLFGLPPGLQDVIARPRLATIDGKHVSEGMSIDLVRDALKAMAPNNFETRDEWVAFAHAVYGATGGSVEGMEAFLEFSYTHHQTPGEPERVWESFTSGDVRAGAGMIRREMERRGLIELLRRANQEKAERCFADDPDDPEEPRTKPKKEMTIPEAVEDALQQLREARDEPGHAEHASGGGRKGFQRLTQDVLAEPPLIPPTIDSRFVKGVLHGVMSAPGLGKSTMIDLEAVAFAANRPDLVGEAAYDYPGAFIIISNEDGASVVKRRVGSLVRMHGVQGAADNIYVWADDPMTLISETDGKVGPTQQAVQVIRKLAEIRKETPIAHIVVDTLASAQSGVEENSVAKMGPMMDLLLKIARAGFAAVTAVTHKRKEGPDSADTGFGKHLPTAADMRGSTLLSGSIRHIMDIDRPSEKDAREYGFDEDEVTNYIRFVGAKVNSGIGVQLASRRLYRYSTTQVLGRDARDPDSLRTIKVSVLELATPADPQDAQIARDAAMEEEVRRAAFILTRAYDETLRVGGVILRGNLASGAGRTSAGTAFVVVNEDAGRKRTDARGRQIVSKMIEQGLLEEYEARHNKETVQAVRPSEDGRIVASQAAR